MKRESGKVFYGWYVVLGSSLVSLGVAGTQFSFGAFLTPMTQDFGWSRATLSLAFGITFMLSGLARPLAGYLADRYSPKVVALSGVALLGLMLLVIPSIQNLAQLYAVFAVMSIGLTLGTGPILTKIVSSWFYAQRRLLGYRVQRRLLRRADPGSRVIHLPGAVRLEGCLLLPFRAIVADRASLWRVAH